MKKCFLLMLMAAGVSYAQDTLRVAEPGTELLSRRNEVRTDLLSTVMSSQFNLTYERFLSNDWSVGLTGAIISNRYLDDDFDAGYRNSLPKYEINPFVRYKLSESIRRFYFAEVFASANGGDFKEIVRQTDEAGNGYYVTEKSQYSDIGIGAGLGYKMYLQEKFAIELLVAFGTNLFDRDRSPDTISRVGLSVGYRF